MLFLDGETFKLVKFHCTKFAVSNFGRVMSSSSLKDGVASVKVHETHVNANGYKVINVYEKLTAKVHQLVADAFIPQEPDKPYIIFKDGDMLNCSLENLKRATIEEAYGAPYMRDLHKLNGVVKTRKEWAEELKIPIETLNLRYTRLPDELKHTEEGDLRILAVKHFQFTVNGVTKSVSEWAAECGRTYFVLAERIKQGYPPEEVISRESFLNKKKERLTKAPTDPITVCGVTKTLYEWLKYLEQSALAYYIRQHYEGWSHAEALFTPYGLPKIDEKDIINIDGVVLSLPDWWEVLSVTKSEYEARLAKGMTPYEALTSK